MTPDLPSVLTADEVARALRIPKPTVYRLARAGELPSFRIGNAVRFLRTDIERLLETEQTA